MASAPQERRELPLEDRILSWAVRELRLSELPPQEVLAQLVRPPRAAALFTALVERVRAGEHVSSARAASALRPRAGDDEARADEDLACARRAGREADALEEEVRGMQTRLAGLHAGKRRRARERRERGRFGKEVAGAMQGAYAEALRGLRGEMETAVGAVEGLKGDGGEGEGGVGGGEEGAAAEDVRDALGAVGEAALAEAGKGEGEDATERAVFLVEKLAARCDTVATVKALAAEAESETKFSECDVARAVSGVSLGRDHGKVGSEAEENGGVVEDGRSVFKELQMHQMEVFLEAEDAISAVREAEAVLYAAESSTSVSEASLYLARLAGETAALAEADRIERELRMSRTPAAAARDVEVERTRTISARANLAEASLTAQDRVLTRLVLERTRLLQAISVLQQSLHAILSQSVPRMCSSVSDGTILCDTEARKHVKRVAGLSLARDGLVKVGDVWRPASSFDVLREGDEEAVAASATGVHLDAAISYLLELNSKIDTSTALRDVLSAEAKQGALSARTLASRASIICETIERERARQDEDGGKRLSEAISLMEDCSRRLVPAAREEVRTWWTQPVRKAAPWATARGRNLTEWEIQVAERSSPAKSGTSSAQTEIASVHSTGAST